MDEKIISLIFSLGRLVREHSDEEKVGAPSFFQLEMMKRIDDTQGLTMKDMAVFLCIKAPSVTYLMEELVELGYAKRSQGTADRRMVKIVLTSKGKKILDTLYPLRALSLREVVNELGTVERKMLVSILERIHEIYQAKKSVKK
jgi:DNA-binding MarR family transcriptional regulator